MTPTDLPPVRTTSPRMHFAPRNNWMNDPNGLVFHDGLYHLYFQYNPQGVEHANLSWGHATSADLLRWTEHDPAILWDDTAQIYSGSVVVDHGNTSGFGTDQDPALVALYTAAAPGRQAQALAYSTDGGYVWTKYDGNPVLDRGTSDFRDPKVFRYDDGGDGYWVMVAVEAEDRQVLFHRSDDLTTWTFLSSYGPAGPVGGVWECPDMFPLAVDGDDDDVRWVLLISLNPGGIAGGSGTHYVVGDFDGTTFRASVPHPAPPRELLRDGGQSRDELERYGWIDFGPDCYAGVTFDGLARDERTLIAWMDNWEYAGRIPGGDSNEHRSAMTLPRRLSLTRDEVGAERLRQRPAVDLDPGESIDLAGVAGSVVLAEGVAGAARVGFTATFGDAQSVELHIESASDDGRVVIRQDRTSGRIELVRSGEKMPLGFHRSPSMRLDRPREVGWDLWIDDLNERVSSIELFAQNGERVLTALVPVTSPRTYTVVVIGGTLHGARADVAERGC
ncbi:MULTISPECIES: glycoside hydrolase family 32 protein [Microbacterium]|uniref:Glycoside hydrolase family 32 protein n=1 Tax=Microbacterium maritypicum TaxID=33918 RepID=A0AAJ5VBR4_MICMQ|nr:MULTISPECIES: glycoside hydrolase family 32 protein [Microbacterium]WEF21334.1 glycoside hydrolase family 32 protein [Microbacterium liquefaciens]